MGLFKPAWMNNNKEKALKAVSVESDENILLDIVTNAPDFRVRCVALDKLTNQNLLISAAIHAISMKNHEDDNSIRNLALKKISEANLAKIVIDNGKSYQTVANEALELITDKSLLLDILQNIDIWEIQKEAIIKMTEATADGWSVDNEGYAIGKDKKKYEWELELNAVSKLTNQSCLLIFAQKSNHEDVRNVAVGRISDQSILFYIAKNDKTDSIRKTAVSKISDPQILADLIMNEQSPYIVWETVNRRQIFDHSILTRLLIDIANNSKYGNTYAGEWVKIREKAISKLTDINALEKIVNGESEKYCYAWIADEILGRYKYSLDLRETARKRLAEINKKG